MAALAPLGCVLLAERLPALKMERSRESDVDVIAQDSALLSACEVGLGSVLHAFHVPLAGYFLSLNQVFLLSRSLFTLRDPRAPLVISSTAAVLKALSPAGKKLTPMLAISMQGGLFALGPAIFGANVVGASIGGALSSVWGFLQPALLAYLLFGSALVTAIEAMLAKIADSISFLHLDVSDLLVVACVVVGLKALLAIACTVLAYHLPDSRFSLWQKRLLDAAARSPKMKIVSTEDASFSARMRLALRDLINPLFVFSMALTMTFFFFADAPTSQLIWIVLRPLALGFCLFLAVRSIPLGWIETRLPVVAGALKKMRKLLG